MILQTDTVGLCQHLNFLKKIFSITTFETASTSKGFMWLRFLVKEKTGKNSVPFDTLQFSSSACITSFFYGFLLKINTVINKALCFISTKTNSTNHNQTTGLNQQLKVGRYKKAPWRLCCIVEIKPTFNKFYLT